MPIQNETASADVIKAVTTYWEFEIERLRALYGLEGEEIIPLSGDEAAEYERLNAIYGQRPFHLFMLEAAKFHGDMAKEVLDVFVEKVPKRSERAERAVDMMIAEFRKQIDELRKQIDGQAGLIDPNEFISAAQVIRSLPAPKVRIHRGLCQYVSRILIEACKSKGAQWHQFRDGSLFPKAVIDEEKLAGLDDKIRQYAAGLKLRQILCAGEKMIDGITNDEGIPPAFTG